MKTYFPFLVLSIAVLGCSKVIPPETDDDGKNQTNDTDDDSECIDDMDCLDGQICSTAGECVTGDRDNDFENATPIMQNSPEYGWIAPASDVDYCLYPSPGNEWVRINTKTNVTDCSEESTESVDVNESLDTVVSVYGPNGALHAYMDNFPTGRVSKFDSVLNVYLPSAGDWYIAVEDTSTFYDSEDGPRSEPDFFYCLEVTSTESTTGETDASDTLLEREPLKHIEHLERWRRTRTAWRQ